MTRPRVSLPWLASLAWAIGLAPLPATAQMWERCTDLWFTRSQILARAGACLEDPAAARLFDNTDCTGATPKLSAADRDTLAAIEGMAAGLDCGDEIGPGVVRFLRPDLRLRLEALPVPTTDVRGCYLWGGDPIYVFAGPDEGSDVLGAAAYGEDIFWEYTTPGAPAGWAFITVYLDGALSKLGWSNEPIEPALCGAIIE